MRMKSLLLHLHTIFIEESKQVNLYRLLKRAFFRRVRNIRHPPKKMKRQLHFTMSVSALGLAIHLKVLQSHRFKEAPEFDPLLPEETINKPSGE